MIRKSCFRFGPQKNFLNLYNKCIFNFKCSEECTGITICFFFVIRLKIIVKTSHIQQ